MPNQEKQEKLTSQKVVQYLNEAHAMELAMVQTLTAHIALTPRSAYRSGLERHLAETRRHAERLERRLDQLGEGRNPLQFGFAAAQAAIGQTIVMAKAPVDVIRGASSAEKLLKNAKDESVSEELEIVTYRAIQRLAEAAGDDITARLAMSIRQEERDMQSFLHEQVDVLTEAVVKEELRGQKVFDLSTVGAADSVRRLAGRLEVDAENTADEARRTARTGANRARRTGAVARSEARRTVTTAARGSRRTATAARRGATRTARTAS